MRIIVDIGHPAHVHFFKNFIWQMKEKKHELLITATNKDGVMELLNNYGFDYIVMGNYGNQVIKKAMNIPIMDIRMIRVAIDYKPDLFIGISAVRAAHASNFLKKPCIIFDDTEHSKWELRLYTPFADVICTPSCFRKNLGEKQRRYNGYHELAYLHPNYFKPDPSVLTKIGLSEKDRFIIVRFVSWHAGHDIGQHGFTSPKEIIPLLEPYGRVLITSEAKLDADLERYRITVPIEEIHHLLYYATLYIGEGATMASECAVLGTPAIYVNTLRLGYLDEQEAKYGLVYNFSNPEIAQRQALARAIGLLQSQGLKQEWQLRKQKMLEDKIDVTRFMVELAEKYGQKAALREAVSLS